MEALRVSDSDATCTWDYRTGLFEKPKAWKMATRLNDRRQVRLSYHMNQSELELVRNLVKLPDIFHS
jgi:hypothetical protein